jgi:glycosyltransferase involved in cell wall biosynthesis
MTVVETEILSPARATTPAISGPPLVSVVICAHNAGRFLRDAIQSIVKQTHRNLEILVIDDGSTDGSVDAVRDIDDSRIRWITQPHLGKPAALNRALELMTGKYYAIQDADDESFPNRIERQVLCMENNPDLAIAFCGYNLILNERRVAPIFFERSRERCRRMIARIRLPQHDPTAMYRCSLVRQYRYANDLRIGQGIDYVMQIGERYPMLVMPECLYTYRVHQGGVTKRDPSERLKYSKEVQRRALIRRGMDPSPLEISPELQPRTRWRNRDYDNNLAARFVESVVSLRADNKIVQAIRTGIAGAAIQPLDPYYWKALIYSLLPQALVRQMRRSWV